MQRLRRLQTPQLYQVKLSHLASLTAVLTLYATTPLRIIRLNLSFVGFLCPCHPAQKGNGVPPQGPRQTMFRGSDVAKGKSHCIARLPGFWTGNAAKVLVNPRDSLGFTEPKIRWWVVGHPEGQPGGARRVRSGRKSFPAAQPRPRGPSPAHRPKLRPPEANRPGASCWQRNLGTAP